MTDKLELTVRKTVPVDRDTAFRAWLDPKMLEQFIRPAPGMSTPKVEVDAQEGGKFLIVMRAGESDLEHRGEYKVIDPPETLAFTWLSDYTIDGSLVTLNFKELGPKETEIVLHHEGFANEDARNNHEGGWANILAALAQALG